MKPPPKSQGRDTLWSVCKVSSAARWHISTVLSKGRSSAANLNALGHGMSACFKAFDNDAAHNAGSAKGTNLCRSWTRGIEL